MVMIPSRFWTDCSRKARNLISGLMHRRPILLWLFTTVLVAMFAAHEVSAFSFDYYVTDSRSRLHNAEPSQEPIPSMALGANFNMTFDIVEGAGECTGAFPVCLRQLSNFSIISADLNVESPGSEPLEGGFLSLHEFGDRYFASVDFRSHNFTNFGRAGQFYAPIVGPVGVADNVRGSFWFEFLPAVSNGENIDLATVEIPVDSLIPQGLVASIPSAIIPQSERFTVFEFFGVLPPLPPITTVDRLDPRARFTAYEFSPGGRTFSWLGGSGDFQDSDQWTDGGIPGDGITPADIARIDALGTYSISSAPENELGLLVVGNPAGVVTLEPILGEISTDNLDIVGDTSLEFGTLNVHTRGVVNSPRKLTIGTAGILDAAQMQDAFTVRGELHVNSGGVASFASLAIANEDETQAVFNVVGPLSRVEIGTNFVSGFGDTSNANLLISEGAEVSVGQDIDLGGGEFSVVNLVLTGPDSILRGKGDTVGVPTISIGRNGLSNVDVQFGAELTLGSFLSLGEQTLGFGRINIGPGGLLRTPDANEGSVPLLPLSMIVGANGAGEITVDEGGNFLAGSLRAEELVLGLGGGGNGQISIASSATDNNGNILTTEFATTTIGRRGDGTLDLSGGARWASEIVVLGEESTGNGSLFLSGSESRLGMDGRRLLVVGGAGNGLLQLTDGAMLAAEESNGTGDLPLEVFVGLDSHFGAASTGRLQILDNSVVTGGVESRLNVGANSTGGTGFALISDSSVTFNTINVGLNANAPGVGDTILATGLRGANIQAATSQSFILPPDAPDGTTGQLIVTGLSDVTLDEGLGALNVGSRGYLQVESGAQVNTGLLSIGLESTVVGKKLGNGAIAKVDGLGTRVNAEVLLVGEEGGSAALLLDNDAVINVNEARFTGEVVTGIANRSAIISEGEIHIGSPLQFPEFNTSQDNFGIADESVIVNLSNFSSIVSATSIIVGDNTRAGTFEPLVTNAVVVLDETSTLHTPHLIIANGGAVQGTPLQIEAERSEVLDGGILDPGRSPGALNFSGDLILHEGARVRVEVAGNDATLIDRIGVGGELIGTGILEVNFIDGFIPEVGEIFSFFDIEDASVPSFDEILISGLGVGAIVDFSTEFNTNGVLTVLEVGDISAVPLPPAMLMFVGGLLIINRFGLRANLFYRVLRTG